MTAWAAERPRSRAEEVLADESADARERDSSKDGGAG